MVKVLIKKLDPGVKLPEYKTSGASGVDLIAFIREPINLEPKTSVLIPTGLSVAFPRRLRDSNKTKIRFSSQK